MLARSDALTGLPNRRALDDQLPREMARALRADSPLCLAIIDIDHFKVYNDTYGHLAGDAVLRDCAAAWDGALRGEDTILRFGGEEFLVVLPNCGAADAAEIVERLRAATPDGPDLLGGAGALAAGGERRRTGRAGGQGAVRGQGGRAGPARPRLPTERRARAWEDARRWLTTSFGAGFAAAAA